MACPFFWPTQRHEGELWQHRRRLPLGDGFEGMCMAPGCEGRRPSSDELRDACNLGYANTCPHLPQERAADAVHFAGGGDELVQVQFVTVKGQAPASDGVLQYESASGEWKVSHPDAILQRMAEVFVESWLEKRGRRTARQG